MTKDVITMDLGKEFDDGLYLLLGKCVVEFGRIEYLLDHVINRRFTSRQFQRVDLTSIGTCKKKFGQYKTAFVDAVSTQGCNMDDSESFFDNLVDLNDKWNDWKHAAYGHVNETPIRKRAGTNRPLVPLDDLKALLEKATKAKNDLIPLGPKIYSHALGTAETSVESAPPVIKSINT